MTDAREKRVDAAVAALREFMDENLAASKIELEAKLIEAHYDAPPFEPAHLQDARNKLLEAGAITIERVETRGGRTPPLLVTADRHRRNRKVEDASARKRLLMSRYYSYVEGSAVTGQGLTGDAGELAFQAAFLRASVGASLATVSHGIPSVAKIREIRVDLDNGFLLGLLDKVSLAPVGPFGVEVLVEVKNLREWVYPRTQELYQVLDKAARVQHAFPGDMFLPMLVCRRARITTTFMAAQLGFFVIDARRHYFPRHSQIDPKALLELVHELGLNDVTQENGHDVTQRTESKLVTLQRHFDVGRAIERWQRHSADDRFRELIHRMNDDRLPNLVRDRTLNELRALATGPFRLKGGW